MYKSIDIFAGIGGIRECQVLCVNSRLPTHS
jgi:hypothetical protein